MTVIFEGYVDLEATERQRFEALPGIGESRAQTLVERFETVANAADALLGCPVAYPPELAPRRTDELRDALERAGFTPPCGCDSYEAVHNSQTRDDVVSHCETCGEVIQS